MDAVSRKPFQGVGNIIRFNWHFYAIALLIVGGLVWVNKFLPSSFYVFVYIFIALALLSLSTSLIVSWYVYDWSGLYNLKWLDRLCIQPGMQLTNIHAGFDETSVLIAQKFPDTSLTVLDFYDPSKHTEVSIKRARTKYPAYPGTISIATSDPTEHIRESDFILLILSAHEIRSGEERIHFFRQLRQKLKQGGKIVVVEHLRDLPNFLAYTIGFFHFHSRKEWIKTFDAAGLMVEKEQKLTRFISLFILQPNGVTS